MTAPGHLNLRAIALEHADAIQILASDAAIAATTRIPHPDPGNAAREFISKQIQEEASGNAHVLVIGDAETVVGACGLHGLAVAEAAEIGY